MMNDIKSCFQLLRYGYQFKMNTICSLIFIPIGFLFVVAGYERLPLCCAYFFLALLYLAQSMQMLMFAGCVQASPARRRIELRYLDIINMLGGIVASFFTILLAFLAEPEEMGGICAEGTLVICGMMAIVIYLYMAVAYKSMFWGFVVFFPAFVVVMDMPYGRIGDMIFRMSQEKTVISVGLFLTEILVGMILSHGVRKLLYRKNMSKWAAGAKLRAEQ